jgi:glycosyltransferase involved in cell wall biosynthesis
VLISIVIPAHDEEASIGRTLQTIVADARPGEFEILVICNGCRDRTAQVASAFAPTVKVVETEIASKSHALNRGDESATGFPRFYIDADVEIGTEAIRCIARTLTGGILAAAPRRRLDLDGRPWTVRAYYRLWQEHPDVRTSLFGTGVYALSEEGRARFGAFPDIIADDLFVHRLFSDEERRSVESCESVVRPARSFAGLVRRKVRVFAGNYQLERSLGPQATRRGRRGSLLGVVLRQPKLLGCLPVYVAVSVLSKVGAARKVRRGDDDTWERDDSTSLPVEGKS